MVSSQKRKNSLGLLLSLFPIITIVVVLPIFEHLGTKRVVIGDVGSLDTAVAGSSEYVHPVSLHHFPGSSFLIPRRYGASREIVSKHRSMCHGIKYPLSYRSGKKQKKKNANGKKLLRTITILGERHSATNWVLNELTVHFPKTTIGNVLYRPKFMFQDEMKLGDTDLSDVLVIVLSRHPLTWLLEMFLQPSYAPGHQMGDFSTFLKKPWLPGKQKVAQRTKFQKCQYKFEPNKVSPCHRPPSNKLATFRAVYEHDQATGQPFENILKLRSAKMEHFQQFKRWLPNVLFVRMEDVSSKPGIDKLIKQIQDQYPELPTCQSYSQSYQKNFHPPSLNLVASNKTSTLSGGKNKISGIAPNLINKAFCEIEWDIETSFGYNKDDVELIHVAKELSFFNVTTCPGDS